MPGRSSAILVKARMILDGELDDFLLIGKIEANLGALYAYYGEWEISAETITKAISFYSKTGNLYWLSFAQSMFAFVLMQLGEYERASQVVLKSLSVATTHNYVIARSNALMALSELKALFVKPKALSLKVSPYLIRATTKHGKPRRF